MEKRGFPRVQATRTLLVGGQAPANQDSFFSSSDLYDLDADYSQRSFFMFLWSEWSVSSALVRSYPLEMCLLLYKKKQDT